MDSTFWASLISPITNLLRLSTVIDCGNSRDIGLLRGIANGYGKTDSLGVISVGAIILIKEQSRRTKIYKASDIAN